MVVMGSGERTHHWSVFDAIKSFPSSSESLMAEINAAISKHEYAHASAMLESPSSSAVAKNNSCEATNDSPAFDARMADEAYKAGCAALAAGKLDVAFHSLNLSLLKCPPDKTIAVAKLQSLISLTSKHLRKSTN